MSQAPVIIERGLPQELRPVAVKVFDEAFGAKLSLAIPAQEKRLAVISDGLVGGNIIIATVGDELVGVAALATRGGRYDGGGLSYEWVSWSMLRRHLGTFGALRAAFVMLFYDHKPKDDELYLEDIAVAAEARGLGIGTKLLAEVETIAREEGKARVELEVIDTNPRAQELYARQGYVVVKTDRFGFLRRILGFGGVYTMDLFLDGAADERA